MKNLKHFGVQEIGAKEITQVNGGNPIVGLFRIGIALYGFHVWYQDSGYIDDEMGIPFGA